MNNEDETLFFSIHYRRSLFFEDTVLRIANAGYKFLIYHTGGENRFDKFGIQHPNIIYRETTPTSFDGAMMELRQSNLFNGYKYLIHLDNDCFLSGTLELEEYLHECVEDRYDFVCHTVGKPYLEYNEYPKRKQITEVQDIKFLDGEPPVPVPHFENAYLFITKRIWDRLTVHDVGHMRRFIHAVYKNKAKIGAHKCKYMWNYTNYGMEWFHIGHLMEKYLTIESGQNLTKYNSQSSFDQFRIAYFVAQEEIYGHRIYQDNTIRNNLERLYEYMGSREYLLSIWNEITKETCMENWKKC